MATFTFGRALLCALLSLSLVACGPGECEDDTICKDDAGDCPLGNCQADGGDNIPRAISHMIVKVPVDLTIEATYYLSSEMEETLDPGVRRFCTIFPDSSSGTWKQEVQVAVGQEVSIQLPLGYYHDSAGRIARGVTCPGIYRLEAKNVPEGWVCGYFDMTCTEEAVDQPVDFINGFRCAHNVRGHFQEVREDPELPPWNYDVETRVDGDGVTLLDVQEGEGTIGGLEMNILTLAWGGESAGFVSPDHNTITVTGSERIRTLTRSQTSP